jgi:hypothetical protein
MRRLPLTPLALLLTWIAGCSQAADSPAPANLLPNTQWEVWSGVGPGTKWNVEGRGTMAPIAVLGNSIGRGPVTLRVGATGELKNGDLVHIAGAGADPALLISDMRVFDLRPNVSFEVTPPLGRPVSISHGAVAIPEQVGGLAARGTGDAADYWKKTVSMPVWREDNAANLPSGALYALGANKDLAGLEVVSLRPTERGPADTIRHLRGRTLVFGAEVFQKVRGGAGTFFVYIESDGTGGRRVESPRGAGSAGYEWREATLTVPADATYVEVGVGLEGAAGDTYYLAQPVLAFGAALGGPQAYSQPSERLRPISNVTPRHWVNQTLRFPAAGNPFVMFDPYAETGGMIAPSITHIHGNIEGIDAAPVRTGEAGSRVIGWFSTSGSAPALNGSILGQYGQDVKSFGPLDILLDARGLGWFRSGIPGDVWYNVSVDYDGFDLAGDGGAPQ